MSHGYNSLRGIKRWSIVLLVATLSSAVFVSFRQQVRNVNNHLKSAVKSNGQCTGGCFASSYWDELLNSDAVTASQIMEYFMWPNRSSCQLAHDIGGIMLNNPSGVAGQKTVCLDPQVMPKPKHCLVYSFGISDEWSFDEQMERYGCQVFAFDPSMGIESHDHSPGVHFYNWGLSNRDEFDKVENWTMRSLSSIYNSLSSIHGSDTIIDYLKIDVEYSEWLSLPEMISSGMLSKVRQLGIEVHMDEKETFERLREWTKLMRSVELMGMVRFDSKYNLWSMRNFTKFQLLGPIGHEIAWYNSKLYHSTTGT